MSVSLWRQVKNAYQSGLKRYAWQIATLGDAKGAGEHIGTDDYGNNFYETKAPEEIHLRTRWVEYKTWGMDMSQVEPGWHYWLAYGTDTPPNKLSAEQKSVRAYPTPAVHKLNLTGTPGAYVSYNTAKPKCEAWTPKVAART